MGYLKASESYFLAPILEVLECEIESVTELNQHIERHHKTECVLLARVINQILDRYEGSSRGKRRISGVD